MDELTPICQMKDLPLGGSTTCRRESLEPCTCEVVVVPYVVRAVVAVTVMHVLLFVLHVCVL